MDSQDINRVHWFLPDTLLLPTHGHFPKNLFKILKIPTFSEYLLPTRNPNIYSFPPGGTKEFVLGGNDSPEGRRGGVGRYGFNRPSLEGH